MRNDLSSRQEAQGVRSEEELSMLAGQVLISALAVPVTGAAAGKIEGVEVEEVKGRVGRLSALLGLTRTPTRAALLKEAVSKFASIKYARITYIL